MGTNDAGVIDTKGNWVIKPEAPQSIIIINEDHIALKKEDKWGIVNRKGDTVADFLFDGIIYPGTGEPTLIPAKLGNKWGYIDLNGKFVINPIYERAMPFSGELAAVFTEVKDDYYAKGGYVNKDGKMVYAINLKN